ncbi:flocculation-associated PEP-CTERM protein PepA [Candidatus Methylocalor cossyra]|uniref:PEP-CTERM protein-sorting domain-containing protein n=1 Tax=Candidatus Methylocalor cossyra TaxID=3108543 RepID=A0ABM9NJG7_9GAMM
MRNGSLRKQSIAAALGAVLMGGGAAHAATFSTPDGVLPNFVGFDWHANGAAWVRGFDLTSSSPIGATDTFTLTYQAFAGSILNTSGPNLFVPPNPTGTYDITTFSTLQETATCLSANCSSISISITGPATWDVYLNDFSKGDPKVDPAAGTGFVSGTKILSGVWTSENATFFASDGANVPGSTGTGSAFLDGTVTFTNTAYIDPSLLGSNFQASLQFPGQTNIFTRPAAFNGVATGPNTATDFVLQTDGSQQFTAGPPPVVPEPGTLALLGLGAAGLAAQRRRKAS